MAGTVVSNGFYKFTYLLCQLLYSSMRLAEFALKVIGGLGCQEPCEWRESPA